MIEGASGYIFSDFIFHVIVNYLLFPHLSGFVEHFSLYTTSPLSMTSLRLTFLYPHLFRSIRASKPISQSARECYRNSSSQRASFATTSRKQQRFVERHGKAVEPFLMPGGAKDNTKGFVPESTPTPTKDNASCKMPGSEGDSRDGTNKTVDQKEPSSEAPLPEEMQAAAWLPGDLDSGVQETQAIDKGPPSAESAVQSTEEIRPPQNGPLEKIPQTEQPPEGPPEDYINIPHLHPPPYVHNFDSYTLVKEVEKGGFTTEQAITAMKAVRVLLADNLEMAKKGLVSKSDVENVSYFMYSSSLNSRSRRPVLTILDL